MISWTAFEDQIIFKRYLNFNLYIIQNIYIIIFIISNLKINVKYSGFDINMIIQICTMQI